MFGIQTGSSWDSSSTETGRKHSITWGLGKGEPNPNHRCGLFRVVRNAPDAALLRIRYVKRSIRSYRRADRTISSANGIRRRCIEGRESISKDRGRPRLATLVKRNENHIVAVLVASSMQNYERAATIGDREFIAGIEH